MSRSRIVAPLFALLVLFAWNQSTQAQSVGTPKNNAGARISYIQRQIDKFEDQLLMLADDRSTMLKEKEALKQLHEKLQKEQDEQGISVDSFAEVVKSLQSQRVELMIDLAGMEARRSAIFELKKQMEKEAGDVVEQLTELLKVEEEELQRMEKLYEKGTASRSEYQKSKSRMLEVKIRLAEARRPSKGSTVLNDELLNSSLNRAEKKARLEKTESLLSTFTSSRKNLEQADSTKVRIGLVDRRISRSDNQVQMVTDQLNNWKAQMEELRANEEKEKKKDDQ